MSFQNSPEDGNLPQCNAELVVLARIPARVLVTQLRQRAAGASDVYSAVALADCCEVVIAVAGGALNVVGPEDGQTPLTVGAFIGAEQLKLFLISHACSKWNVQGQPVIRSPPWDTDGDPASFSEAELGQIKAIWSIVAEGTCITFQGGACRKVHAGPKVNSKRPCCVLLEQRFGVTHSWRAVLAKLAYYAAFDVDVTTKDPGDAALLGVGVRVVIGGDSPGGVAMGGVAWQREVHRRGGFTRGGHTLGLLHDDNVPDGNIWGPIMLNLTLWSKGEYYGATNKQDDYAVMGQFLDLLPQQYGSSIAAATPMPSARSSSHVLYQASGVIANQGQVDFFSFAAAAGNALDISAAGAGSITTRVGGVFNIGNLDMLLTLYSPSGAVLQSANPPGATTAGLGAQMRVTLPETGTYYISVAGVGAGDPAGYGYSSYGSRGQYSLSVQGSTSQPTPTASPSPALSRSPSPAQPPPSVSPSPAASPSPPLQPSPSWSPEPAPSRLCPQNRQLGADGPSSSCSLEPSPVLGEEGTSALAPGPRQCRSGSAGTYTLTHGASALPLARWECYNVTSGVVQEPLLPPLLQVPSGSSGITLITLHAHDTFTCIAVFELPLPASPSPQPGPPAALALLSLLPTGYPGPGPNLTASSLTGGLQCFKAPAPALPFAVNNSGGNATMPPQQSPAPDAMAAPRRHQRLKTSRRCHPLILLLRHLYRTTWAHPRSASAITAALTTAIAVTGPNGQCHQHQHRLASPAPAPSPHPPRSARPPRMTLSLASSTTYTGANNATNVIARFTLTARDTYTNQPVPNVSIAASLRLSRDDAFTDPRDRYPHDVSGVTGRTGRLLLRAAAVPVPR
ncbi:hypothetical protein COO60DRAFT_1456982 [Scenedesmus sp. NREL 46B-D3]|nr:hypothetical protein COO60DRAFT_1456982 [Scenedesmus sp. NREL 46B-D3]